MFYILRYTDIVSSCSNSSTGFNAYRTAHCMMNYDSYTFMTASANEIKTYNTYNCTNLNSTTLLEHSCTSTGSTDISNKQVPIQDDDRERILIKNRVSAQNRLEEDTAEESTFQSSSINVVSRLVQLQQTQSGNTGFYSSWVYDAQTKAPSYTPTAQPTSQPSRQPSHKPSMPKVITNIPSTKPITYIPTTLVPTMTPSTSITPTVSPSTTLKPTIQTQPIVQFHTYISMTNVTNSNSTTTTSSSAVLRRLESLNSMSIVYDDSLFDSASLAVIHLTLAEELNLDYTRISFVNSFINNTYEVASFLVIVPLIDYPQFNGSSTTCVSTLRTTLVTSIQSGAFYTKLHAYVVTQNITSLLKSIPSIAALVETGIIYPPSYSPTKQYTANGTKDGNILPGIIIGVIISTLAVIALVFYCVQRDKWVAFGQAAVQETNVHDIRVIVDEESPREKSQIDEREGAEVVL